MVTLSRATSSGPRRTTDTTDGRRPGFSLVEILVVVGIIAGLVALLLTAIQAARESARRMQCLFNLRQIGVGLHHHEAAKGFFPTAVTGNGARFYWTAQILPYVDENPLAGSYDFTVACNDVRNREAVQVVVPFMACPSATLTGKRDHPRFKTGSPAWGAAVADYAGSSGPSSTLWNPPATISYPKPGSIDGFFKVAIKPGEKGRRVREISDGTSKSIAIVECAGRPQVWAFGGMSPGSGLASSPTNRYIGQCGWADTNQFAIRGFRRDASRTDPADQYASPGPRLINATNDWGIYGLHPGVAAVLFADGAAAFLDESTAADVVAAQLTIQARDAAFNP